MKMELQKELQRPGQPGMQKHHNLGLAGRGAVKRMEPPNGFEPLTCCLQNSCSTTELRWPALGAQRARQRWLINNTRRRAFVESKP
jgi:hypothetical protein